jgi:hypothetical protein
MRKILLTLTLISVFFVAESQQLHFMSQFLQHNTMYNPAAAGMSATAGHTSPQTVSECERFQL